MAGADACAGLADRWVVLHQRVLAGLDVPGGIDDAAANSNAAAMLEHARDAESWAALPPSPWALLCYAAASSSCNQVVQPVRS